MEFVNGNEMKKMLVFKEGKNSESLKLIGILLRKAEDIKEKKAHILQECKKKFVLKRNQFRPNAIQLFIN